MTTKKNKSIVTWVLRLIAAFILLQTLYFKFSASAESVYIFARLGMEPWGRIGIGVMELIASILILFPRTTVYGSLLAMGLMSGAIFFHLTKLGIEVMNDSGQLFVYGVVVFLVNLALVLIYRREIYSLLHLKINYSK